MEAKMLYDTTVGGIRTVKLDLDGFHAAFTCNMGLGHCTARFEPAMPLAPDVAWAGDALAMTYGHVTVTPEQEAAFEEAYEKARAFCHNAGPYVKDIMSQIEEGGPLKL